MKYVIIVNGKPGSGKTTFERQCVRYLDETENAYGHVISSVDPIKEIYKQLGWNGNKTDITRKHISELKKIWIEACNGPVKYITDFVMQLDNEDDHVIFVDIREDSEIVATYSVFNALSVLDIKCYKLFIDRASTRNIRYDNKSDDMAGNDMLLYDIVIPNDSGLEDLYEKADTFIDRLLDNNMSIYKYT